MRILVTGSDGFIGSHLTEALVKQGYEVKAFTLYNSFDSIGWLDTVSEEVKNQIEIFKGDIRDPNCVRQAMKNSDVVFHLAALIAIPYSYFLNRFVDKIYIQIFLYFTNDFNRSNTANFVKAVDTVTSLTDVAQRRTYWQP